MWYIMYMAVLNLRGIPENLMRRLKADASLKGMTLLDHCVGVLGGIALSQDDQERKALRVGSDIENERRVATSGNSEGYRTASVPVVGERSGNKRFERDVSVYPATEQPEPIVNCCECDEFMKEIKGKFYCGKNGCPMYGQAQRVKR